MARGSREYTIVTPSTASANWLALKKTLPSTVGAPWRKRKRDEATDAPGPVAGPSKAAKILQSEPAEGAKAEPGKHVALDCEFVGVGPDATESMLARVSVVNFHGQVLLDVFVRPKERVTDYRTWVSGVTEEDLRPGGPAIAFEDVQKRVADLLKGRILVGHAVQNDLQVLLLSHPRSATRDTSRYAPLREIAGTKRPALRKLAQIVLGIKIQDSTSQTGHSSVEDAQATMAIYRAHRKEWEISAGSGSGRPKKAKAGAPVAAIAVEEPERQPRRVAGKKRFTLNLAATLRHAQPADADDGLVVHTSESVAVVKPAAKPPVAVAKPTPPSTTRHGRSGDAATHWPSKAPRSSRTSTGGHGDDWWNSAPS